MKKKKAVVMLSGGLDSRLAVKIMQKKGYEVTALHFKLPFSKDAKAANVAYAKKHKVKLKVFDYTKGKLLQEYLELIKKPKHGRGSGINPCIDCRGFMLSKAREYADKNKIKVIASGEVLGQRPMSQHQKGLDVVEKESGLKGRLKRPLIEKGIKGRSRKKQIELAKKFKIKYPNPAGGCLLCEKALKQRLKYLLDRGVDEKEINLIGIGRHFIIDKCWIVLGREEKENNILEKLKAGELIIPETPGPTAIILDKCSKKTIEKVKELIIAYSRGGNREKFEGYLI